MQKNYYATSDFGFACYLKSQGVDFREVKYQENDSSRCIFIFRIYDDSDELHEHVANWASSEKAAQTKRTLYASKLLRTALKEFHNPNSISVK